MKIDLQWGTRNGGATYRVTGKDLESVEKALSGRAEVGTFASRFGHKWKSDAQGNAVQVTLTPSYTITMPAWTNYRRQPQACKDAWDAMWRALKKHEDAHKQIFTQGVSDVVGKLEALPQAKGSEIDALMKKARKDIQAKQNRFDRETDHGRSRGVELVVSDACKRKR